MKRSLILVITLLAACTERISGCELQYLCNDGNYYVINPDPQRYTHATAEGCEGIMSIKNACILQMCKTSPVTLRLQGTSVDSLACFLSCETSRKRRATSTWVLTSLETVLQYGVTDTEINFACHPSGLFFDNPRPELYTDVFAVSLVDNTSCKVWTNETNRIIWLHGCPVEGKVFIVLSKKLTETPQIERFQNIQIVDCGPATPLIEPYKTGESGDITYSCFAPGTIKVINRRSELWTFSYAENNGNACVSFLTDRAEEVIIFGCEQIGITLLVLSKNRLPEEIIVRPNNFFLIDCIP